VVRVGRTSEEGTERVSEPLTHSAVDEQVEWVGDCDETVDEQCGHVARHITEQVHVERVFDDHQQK